MLLWSIIAIPVIWVLGDFIYSAVVARRIQAWEQTFERNEDGVRAGCEAFEEGDAEAADAVLLVHGLNDSPACYRLLAPALADAGFFCRAMRLEGFGEPTEQYAKGTRDIWLRQIATQLKSLRKRHERVHLVGHSLGGALSALHLCDHPESADRLVLLAPGIRVSNARSPVLPTRTWHRISNALLLFTTVTASPFALDGAKVTDEDYPYRTPFTPRAIFDESYAVIDALQSRATDLTTPVLLAVSRNDQVIDTPAAVAFVKAAGSNVKEIEYFDDSGHALLVDHTAERLGERIIAFLRAGSEPPQNQPQAVNSSRPG